MSTPDPVDSLSVLARKTFSPAMFVIGIFLTLGTFVLACRLIWEMTSLTWQEGPQMVGFSLLHGGGAFLILFPPALAIWLIIALIWSVVWKLKRYSIQNRSWLVVVVACATMVLISLPQSFWDALFVNKLARSSHAAELFVYAAGQGESITVHSLLKNGIAVNATDREGSTALHHAAGAGESKLVCYLVDHGANVNAVNLWGDSPLENAVANHRSDTAHILSAHGGKDIKGDAEQRQRAVHQIVSRDIQEMNSRH